MRLKSEKIRLYLRALRLERWPRSLAIFPGTVAVLLIYPQKIPEVLELKSLLNIFLAFIFTWAISTVNYIINEIVDAPYDIHHPTKKNRPFVRKEVKKSYLLIIGLLLILSAFLGAQIFFSGQLKIALLFLFLAGIVYNVKPIRLKDVPYLDSTVESANNPLRFLIGWYVLSDQFPPFSLLICWWCFGNFLMVGKRVAEKKFLSNEQSSSYRLSLSRCSIAGLFRFMIFNAFCVLVTLALFFWEIDFLSGIWLLPLIVVFLAFFIRKSQQDRETAEEPEQLFKNPYFALYSLFLVLIFALVFLFRK